MLFRSEDPLWIEGQLAGLVYVTCVVTHIRQQPNVPDPIKDLSLTCLAKSWDRFADLIHASKATGDPEWNGMHGRVESLLMSLAQELAGPRSPVPDLLASWLAPSSYPRFCPDAYSDALRSILGVSYELDIPSACGSIPVIEEALREKALWQETARFISATSPLVEEPEFHAPFSLVSSILQEGRERVVVETDLHTLADKRFQDELRSIAQIGRAHV